jgi:hypothetical protein
MHLGIAVIAVSTTAIIVPFTRGGTAAESAQVPELAAVGGIAPALRGGATSIPSAGAANE